MLGYKITEQMEIVKNYCNENFPEYEQYILKIIENDLDDKLELVYVKQLFMGVNNYSFYLLMDRNLYDIFNKIQDPLYQMIIVSDDKLKMKFIDEDRMAVNKFIVQSSLLILQDDNISKEFRDYLNKNCENYEDLLKYATIISSGWIKPKFDCVDVILNVFK